MADIKSKLRIAECIKLTGISKTTFYKKYIHGGLISVSKDEHGNKYIARAELFRVFPNAGEGAISDKSKRTKNDENELIAMLKQRVDELNSQLNEEKQRNHELTMKLLDAPAQQRTQYVPPEPEPTPEPTKPAKKRSRLFRVLEALTD